MTIHRSNQLSSSSSSPGYYVNSPKQWEMERGEGRMAQAGATVCLIALQASISCPSPVVCLFVLFVMFVMFVVHLSLYLSLSTNLQPACAILPRLNA
jgi:hypothetical protein